MKRKLQVLEEADARRWGALSRISRLADNEVSGRAPGSMGGQVQTTAAQKIGNVITKGTVRHPGAKAMEFGRTTYYTGYRGRNQKSGSKVKRAGQKPRPFVGIKTASKRWERSANRSSVS